jgi:Ca2+-binding EF-hand superfamily protein
MIRSSGEDIRSWFRMFDENKDDHLEFPEFKGLLKKIGVFVRESDLGKVFDLMDLH